MHRSSCPRNTRKTRKKSGERHRSRSRWSGLSLTRFLCISGTRTGSNQPLGDKWLHLGRRLDFRFSKGRDRTPQRSSLSERQAPGCSNPVAHGIHGKYANRSMLLGLRFPDFPRSRPFSFPRVNSPEICHELLEFRLGIRASRSAEQGRRMDGDQGRRTELRLHFLATFTEHAHFAPRD